MKPATGRRSALRSEVQARPLPVHAVLPSAVRAFVDLARSRVLR